MKSVVRALSMLSTLTFVIGIIVTAIYLYNLPDDLIAKSSVLDIESLQEIQPALNIITLIVGIVMASGLTSLVLIVIIVSSHQKENVVYVEKQVTDHNATSQNAAATEGEQLDTSSLTQEIIKQIKETATVTKEPDKSLENALRIICKELEASQGAVYVAKEDKQRRFVELRASFAYMKPDSQSVRYEYGEGLPGQVAKEGIAINIDAVPEGQLEILSGLDQATPKHLLIVPVKEKEKVIGLVEIASFTAFSTQHQELTTQAFSLLGKQFAGSSEKINVSEEAFEQLEDNSQII